MLMLWIILWYDGQSNATSVSAKKLSYPSSITCGWLSSVTNTLQDRISRDAVSKASKRRAYLERCRFSCLSCRVTASLVVAMTTTSEVDERRTFPESFKILKNIFYFVRGESFDWSQTFVYKLLTLNCV